MMTHPLVRSSGTYFYLFIFKFLGGTYLLKAFSVPERDKRSDSSQTLSFWGHLCKYGQRRLKVEHLYVTDTEKNIMGKTSEKCMPFVRYCVRLFRTDFIHSFNYPAHEANTEEVNWSLSLQFSLHVLPPWRILIRYWTGTVRTAVQPGFE